MEGSKRTLSTSVVVASRAATVEPATSNVNLGVVCPMANERDTAERFIREVLAACEPFRFKSLTFFAVLDRVSRDGTLDLLRGLEATLLLLNDASATENRC